MEIEKQNQYCDELLEWCNNIYFHWKSMKPRFSNLFDLKNLDEWEGSCRRLKEKLQARVDHNDYRTAKNLYEHWKLLYREADTNQEEIEVESDKCMETEEQKQYREVLLNKEWEGSCSELNLQENLKVDFDDYQTAKRLYEEAMKIESEKCAEMEEQKQYREVLLEWCNNIYFHWESMKPRFSNLFDLKSLDEWEESCRKLKEKLQEDLKVDLDDYQTAKRLYEHWEQLSTEANTYQELIEVECDVRS